MEKPAMTDRPLIDEIKNRWSPRALSSDPISPKTLLTVFEAGRWAPSCFNDQPWFYIIAQKNQPDEFEKMLSCLVEKNQSWAVNASVLSIGISRISFSTRDRENRHAFHDLGMSIMNMMTQATSMGLFIHAMAGFSAEKARNIYSIPEGYEPVTALAIGYPGTIEELPEDFRDAEIKPRERKELDSFIFEKNWGEKWDNSK